MDVRRSLHVRRFTNPEGYICRGGGVGSHVHTYVINIHHVRIHRTCLIILPSTHIVDVHTVLSLWGIVDSSIRRLCSVCCITASLQAEIGTVRGSTADPAGVHQAGAKRHRETVPVDTPVRSHRGCPRCSPKTSEKANNRSGHG